MLAVSQEDVSLSTSSSPLSELLSLVRITALWSDILLKLGTAEPASERCLLSVSFCTIKMAELRCCSQLRLTRGTVSRRIGARLDEDGSLEGI
jgi:hypothetical protein